LQFIPEDSDVIFSTSPYESENIVSSVHCRNSSCHLVKPIFDTLMLDPPADAVSVSVASF